LGQEIILLIIRSIWGSVHPLHGRKDEIHPIQVQHFAAAVLVPDIAKILIEQDFPLLAAVQGGAVGLMHQTARFITPFNTHDPQRPNAFFNALRTSSGRIRAARGPLADVRNRLDRLSDVFTDIIAEESANQLAQEVEELAG
jgi:hypothetical protein